MSASRSESGVIAGLYHAAIFPQEWNVALTRLVRHVGADTFHFMMWNECETTTDYNLFSPELMDPVARYAAYYGAIDPRRQITSSLRVGEFMNCSDHFPDSYVGRSEFYQDFLIPSGTRYVLGTRIARTSTQDIVLGLMRAPDRKPFGSDEVRALRQIVTHLCRACELWTRTADLRREAKIGAQLTRASDSSLFGLDVQGRVVYQNPAAHALLRAGDALILSNGRLSASFGHDAGRLRQAITGAVSTGVATGLAIDGVRGGPKCCLVTVARLHAEAGAELGAGEPSVLVIARMRSHETRLTVELLRDVFGMTAAESAVALALVEGQTPEEHALRAGVSIATVRTHLRAVFERTQSRRQAEVVSVLMRLSGGM